MGLSVQQILGTDPNAVQQQLIAREMQALNPTGSAAGALGMLLGGGVANLTQGRGFFEPSTPGLQRVTDVNNILKSVRFDSNNPMQYYQQVGVALQDAGYADLAPLAFSEAQKFKPKEDKVTKIGVSSDGKAVYRSGLNEFTLQNGVPTPFSGSLRAEQSVSVNVGQAQKKEIIKNKADLAAKLETEATNADTQLTNAQAIASVIDRSFTGFGADAVLKVGQIADAFGVTVSGTTESEQLQQLLSKLAQGQAKTLPGSLSEKELMFLREAIGTRGVTKETLRSVARRIEQDSYTTLIGNNKLQKYISEGKDLNNFDFAKNTREARRLSTLLEKASPEQRKQILGY